MFGLQAESKETGNTSSTTKRGAVRSKVRAGASRIKQAVVTKLATRRAKKVALVEQEQASRIEAMRTPIWRAKEIFGEDMHSIDEMLSLFHIDSKLKKNVDLMYVPYSENQLKVMHGYALLVIVFPSASRVAKCHKDSIKIPESVTASFLAKETFARNSYPQFHLIIKPDLTPFLEMATHNRAISIGLKEEQTSLGAYITALVLENAAKSKKTLTKSIRAVAFPGSANQKVIVKYDPQKCPEIVVKLIKSSAPIHRAISWTSAPSS